MAKRVKIDRKKLKQPDEFQSTVSRVLTWAQERQRIILYIALAVIAAAAVTGLMSVYKKSAARKASIMLFQAVRIYEGDGQEADPEGALEMFQELIAKYPRSGDAQAARLYIGNIYEQKGDYAKALEVYDEALQRISTENPIRELTLLDLGHANQAVGDYMKAAEIFRGVAESEQALMADYAYFSLGLNLQLAGKKEEAAEVFQTLIDKYPRSAWSEQARWRMNMGDDGTIQVP